MLVDVNLLLYAIDQESAFHERAVAWIEEALNGGRRVGLAWWSIHAFLRIATSPRIIDKPLTPARAWAYVEDWSASPVVWHPEPGRGHAAILRRLVTDLDLRGNLLNDAALAAVCIEHGLTMVSADSDFARFTEITWINPVAP